MMQELKSSLWLRIPAFSALMGLVLYTVNGAHLGFTHIPITLLVTNMICVSAGLWLFQLRIQPQQAEPNNGESSGQQTWITTQTRLVHILVY